MLDRVEAISAGGTAGAAHTCAIREGGGVWCWGDNSNGQLGDGSNASRVMAGPVIGLTEPVIALATGSHHTCALGVSGDVYCWGSNVYRQLGNEDVSESLVPMPVTLSDKAQSIAGGSSHSCAALVDGRVSCWGGNSDGSLGTSNSAVRFNPTVDGLPPSARQVAADGATSCAVLQSGDVYCWGYNNVGQASPTTLSSAVLAATEVEGLPEPIVEVDTGGFDTCALGESGAVYCWGLGQGVPPYTLLASGATAITVGDFFFQCLVLEDGTAQCNGSNLMGQLGRGLVTLQEPLGAVSDLSGIELLDAGFWHACALASGKVYCWGESAYGQLGHGEDSRVTAPTLVGTGASSVARVAGGGDHSCALKQDGSLLCWGYNLSGQLGDGTLVSRPLPRLVEAPPGRTYSDITAGSDFSCALAQNSSIDCWGSNSVGQLGIGNFDAKTLPTTIPNFASVQNVHAGLFTVCATNQDGAAFCWGANFTGELGDGTTVNRSSPTPVSGLDSGVAMVKPGYGHSCALLTDGSVQCWGSNFFGALGVDAQVLAQSLVPVPVPGMESGVQEIALGYGLSCALMSGSQSVRCWGVYFGSAATTVPGLESGVLSISAHGGNRISGGQTQLCARLDSGEVRCVGANKFGQLGDGSTLDSTTASVAVGEVRSTLHVGVGEHHVCAVVGDGLVRCWGGNAQGQIGAGTSGASPLPVAVVRDVARPNILSPSAGGNAASEGAVSDASGRYIVFQSSASNLVGHPDQNGASDVFRVDLQTGVTAMVSVNDDETPSLGGAVEPSVSASGQLVVFVAPDAGFTKLHGESPTAKRNRLKGGGFGIFLRNMLTGTTQRIAPADPSGAGTQPQLSPSGNAVVFTAPVVNPDQGILGQQNVFRVPLVIEAGDLVPGPADCVTCKTRSAMGLPVGDSDGASGNASISADGQFVAYETTSKNQTVGTASPCPSTSREVMLRNMLTGVVQRVSPAPGTPALACGVIGSAKPSIDWEGRTLAIESDLPIALADGNGLTDVYLFDLDTLASERVSQDPQTGNNALAVSTRPRISGNGRQVSFVSQAANVESSEPDNNAAADILVYARERKRARRVSNSRRGDQAEMASFRPSMSYDGTYVVFDTAAANLQLHSQTGQPVDVNGASDVYRSVSPYLTRGGPDTILLDSFESP